MAELIELQAGYQDWLDSLPESLRDGATAEALAGVCGFDLSELEGGGAATWVRAWLTFHCRRIGVRSCIALTVV